MRAIVAVLDSFGIGASPDADRFGDAGANTFGHIIAAHPKLRIPNLLALGLGEAARAVDPKLPIPSAPKIEGLFGYAAERSVGKDTPSGHWEMMGLPVSFDWHIFPPQEPSFPRELTDALIAQAKLPGILGNRHASGTTIIDELGEEHIRTGKPIVYTSGDSVFQIAAHETHFGLERLYETCKIARKLVDKYNVGRVIARPFIGETPASFKRTGNRHDYSTPPHQPTLLDRHRAKGHEVIGIGKISDIFAGRGISKNVHADGNEDIFDTLIDCTKSAPDNAIIFANFVDFDTLYGHRRDVAGYAGALESFDKRLPELRGQLRDGDLVVLTADHGCDPTWRGSDHTREYVPILAFGPKISSGAIGKRDSFADIGQSLATHFRSEPLPTGTSFL
jgi:phosphopentomutase